jgi:hypothetical protein
MIVLVLRRYILVVAVNTFIPDVKVLKFVKYVCLIYIMICFRNRET